jgi:hypothetical protein
VRGRDRTGLDICMTGFRIVFAPMVSSFNISCIRTRIGRPKTLCAPGERPFLEFLAMFGNEFSLMTARGVTLSRPLVMLSMGDLSESRRLPLSNQH